MNLAAWPEDQKIQALLDQRGKKIPGLGTPIGESLGISPSFDMKGALVKVPLLTIMSAMILQGKRHFF